MKVNGSVGRQALSSLGFSTLILPPPLLQYPSPPVLSFHTIKEANSKHNPTEKQMTSPHTSTYPDLWLGGKSECPLYKTTKVLSIYKPPCLKYKV